MGGQQEKKGKRESMICTKYHNGSHYYSKSIYVNTLLKFVYWPGLVAQACNPVIIATSGAAIRSQKWEVCQSSGLVCEPRVQSQHLKHRISASCFYIVT